MLPGLRSRWPENFSLMMALTLSIVLHALLLAIHFKLPQRLQQSSNQLLEVILVNAKSVHAPDNAQARAQTNLDGGGNSEQERIAKTPLPASKSQRQAQDLMAAQQKIAQMEALQRQLMQQLKSQAQLPPAATQPSQNVRPQVTEGQDMASAALAMARLQGQIDRQYEAYNKRPRKKFIGARATEYRFAQYEEDWRQKIERVGNLNYPQAARGRLYGTLVLTVEIKSDGTLHNITIDRSSGNKILDEAALRIVNQAAPFPAFPPNLADVDIIGITRTWSFTNEDQLQAR